MQQANTKLTMDALKNGMTKNSLMRQLAKHAFDGNYEIGIQRKIKPGDHISNMANIIKDTVIMKHPLNNTTITNSTIEASKYPKGNVENNLQNNRISPIMKEPYKKPDIPPPPPIFTSGTIPPPPPPPLKPKPEMQNFTLPKSNGNAFSPPSSMSQCSSPLTSLSGSGSLSPSYDKQVHNDIPPRQLTSALLNKMLMKDMNKDKNESESKPLKSFNNSSLNKSKENLNISNGQDNKRFSPKQIDENIIPYVGSISLKSKESPEKTNGDKIINFDSPIKLREKKRIVQEDKNSGKRDSLLVSRPLSTIASVDIVDQSYPICNQCNKQITR